MRPTTVRHTALGLGATSPMAVLQLAAEVAVGPKTNVIRVHTVLYQLGHIWGRMSQDG